MSCPINLYINPRLSMESVNTPMNTFLYTILQKRLILPPNDHSYL